MDLNCVELLNLVHNAGRLCYSKQMCFFSYWISFAAQDTKGAITFSQWANMMLGNIFCRIQNLVWWSESSLNIEGQILLHYKWDPAVSKMLRFQCDEWAAPCWSLQSVFIVSVIIVISPKLWCMWFITTNPMFQLWLMISSNNDLKLHF